MTLLGDGLFKSPSPSLAAYSQGTMLGQPISAAGPSFSTSASSLIDDNLTAPAGVAPSDGLFKMPSLQTVDRVLDAATFCTIASTHCEWAAPVRSVINVLYARARSGKQSFARARVGKFNHAGNALCLDLALRSNY